MDYLREGIPLGHLSRLHLRAHWHAASRPWRYDARADAAMQFARLNAVTRPEIDFGEHVHFFDHVHELPEPAKPPAREEPPLPEPPRELPNDDAGRVIPPREWRPMPAPGRFARQREESGPSPASLPGYAGELE